MEAEALEQQAEQPGWQIHSCTCLYQAAITASTYDSQLELLWCGYVDGRVTSFNVSQFGDHTIYSSFQLPSPVVELLSLPSGHLLCVAEGTVSVHEPGGLRRAAMAATGLHNPKGATSASAPAPAPPVTFRSACLLAESIAGDHLFTVASVGTSRVLLGTSSGSVLVLEVNTACRGGGGKGGRTIRALVQVDLEAAAAAGGAASVAVAVTSVACSATSCLAATSSGRVHVLDGRQLLKAGAAAARALKAQPHTTSPTGPRTLAPLAAPSSVPSQVLLAYQSGGHVTRMSVDPVDCRTLYYCGVSSYSDGPTPSAAKRTNVDPRVHVVDLRSNLRQLAPITLPLSSPALVGMVPVPVDRGDGVLSLSTSAQVLTVGASGPMQLNQLNAGLPDLAAPTAMYAPIQSLPRTADGTHSSLIRLTAGAVFASSLAVSPSGQFLSLGCSNGYVIQFCNSFAASYGYSETIQAAMPVPGEAPRAAIHPRMTATRRHNAAGLSNAQTPRHAHIFALRAPHSQGGSYPPPPPPHLERSDRNPRKQYYLQADGAWPPKVSYFEPARDRDGEGAEERTDRYYDESLLQSAASYTVPNVHMTADEYEAVVAWTAHRRAVGQRRDEVKLAVMQAEGESKRLYGVAGAGNAKAGAGGFAHSLLVSDNPLSALASTPRLLTDVYRRAEHAPPRLIAPELLKDVTDKDFLGSVPNPGFERRNSLVQLQQEIIMRGVKQQSRRAMGLQGADPNAPEHPLRGPFSPYRLCNPRWTQDQLHCIKAALVPPASAISSAAARASTDNDDDGDVEQLEAQMSAAFSQVPEALARPINFINNSTAAHDANGRMQRIFQRFDYSPFNQVPPAESHCGLYSIGLDSIYHYSGTVGHLAPLLQVLFALVPLREAALQMQTRDYQGQAVAAEGAGSVASAGGRAIEARKGVAGRPAVAAGAGASSRLMGSHSVFARASDTSYVAELAFVFHNMLRACEYRRSCVSGGSGGDAEGNEFDDVVVLPTRLQQVIAHCEDAKSMALLAAAPAPASSADSTQATRTTATGPTAGVAVQSLLRYLLRQLASELDAQGGSRGGGAGGERSNAVDRLFSLHVQCRNHYLKSKHVEVAPSTRATTLELIDVSGYVSTLHAAPTGSSATGYRTPYIKPGAGAGSSKAMSLAHVLFRSLQRDAYLKGYCSPTASYETFKQTRSVQWHPALAPPLLTLLCGEAQLCPRPASTLPTAQQQQQANTDFTFLARGGAVLSLPRCIEVVATIGESALGEPTAAAESLCYVSCLLLVPGTEEGTEGVYKWHVYDGQTEAEGDVPASQIHGIVTGAEAADGGRYVVHTLDAWAIVSDVRASASSCSDTHAVVHIAQPHEDGETRWVLFNDYCVRDMGRAGMEPEASADAEVLHCLTAHRKPSVLVFKLRVPADSPAAALLNAPLEHPAEVLRRSSVPVSVLSLPSLAHRTKPSVLAATSASGASDSGYNRGLRGGSGASFLVPGHGDGPEQGQGQGVVPGRGDLIAFDAEFVNVESEQYSVSHAGKRTVSQDGRQVLARISLVFGGQDAATAMQGEVVGAVDGREALKGFIRSLLKPQGSDCGSVKAQVLVDDYIVPNLPVTDYVTRFSGITAEDLFPPTSSHSLTTARAAYLKLRCFVDRGCVLVGHGLQKDLDIANLYVPAAQVRDTVNLWRLPGQRKISLRFLSHAVLQSFIQDEVHDSVEDARTALLLYRVHRYVESVLGRNYLDAVVQNLYRYGSECGWATNGRMPAGAGDSEFPLFDTIFPPVPSATA